MVPRREAARGVSRDWRVACVRNKILRFVASTVRNAGILPALFSASRNRQRDASATVPFPPSKGRGTLKNLGHTRKSLRRGLDSDFFRARGGEMQGEGMDDEVHARGVVHGE